MVEEYVFRNDVNPRRKLERYDFEMIINVGMVDRVEARCNMVM